MTTKTQESAEFVAILAEEARTTTDPDGQVLRAIVIADTADELMRLSRSHHYLQEASCNGELTSRQEARERNIEAKIVELAKLVGADRVRFGGDPRGCTVKLVFPSGRTNDWGHEGICVPQ
jgi:hypothetical protein